MGLMHHREDVALESPEIIGMGDEQRIERLTELRELASANVQGREPLRRTEGLG
jgi:hypothetical protein